MGGVTGDNEFHFGFDSAKRIDQEMRPFFFYEPSSKQNISIRLQSLAEDPIRRLWLDRADTRWDKSYLAAILVLVIPRMDL